MSVLVCFAIIAADVIFVSLWYNLLPFSGFALAFIVPVFMMSAYSCYGTKQENREINLLSGSVE